MMNRKILHFDIDAFFASVEQLDHPEYRGKPLIVGGTSDRGVVATCSYEARAYGVKSAMSNVKAHKLCPNGIFVRGRMQRYQDISARIFEYIEAHFDIYEKVSIDEAYIDISEIQTSPMAIAKKIKKDIHQLTGLTISVGISYNKFLAKLASDWNKPDGIFEIKKSDIPELLKPLPIIKIHGLGKKTAERLNRIGIFTIEDLYNYPQDLLQTILGERDVYDRIHGIDLRPIVRNYERKSYGKETTLDVDIDDQHEITTYLLDYLDKIYEVMKGKKWLCKTLVVKIKYTDFEQITRSHSFDNYTNHYETLKEGLYLLIDQIDFYKPVRLVGLTISNLESDHFRQFSLLDLD